MKPDALHFDVIVVGSGAAGLTAALVAAQRGLRTLVVEKADVFGGTTALSGGAAWIPGNHLMPEIGQSDTRAEAEAYLKACLGNHYPAEKMAAYLDSGPEMVRYLEENSAVRFYPLALSDYRPGLPGAKVGRSVLAREYDGRALGDWIKRVRIPLPGYVAFGSMQTDPQHIGKFRRAFRTREGFSFSARRFANFVLDWLRYGKGAHMANGNALVGRLLRSALDAGVTLWNATPALRATTSDGRVTGLVVARGGREVAVTARLGVVLASGGFGGDAARVRQFMPMPGEHVALHPETVVGDGLAIGQAAGGVMPAPNPDNGVWAPISLVRDRDGKVTSKFPHFGLDRGKPGCLIVDATGHRFANEAAPYQDFVNVMHDRRIATAWLVGDHRFLRSYGMGAALPAPLPYKQFVKNGYIVSAPTIAELARRIGVDAAALEQTVARFNDHAAKGVDPDFGKGANIYDNAQGDFEHQPSPNLAPLVKAPFHAVALHPGNVSSVYGLDTSIDGEVLDATGNAVAGLYAVGLDQNSVMMGFYPGGGSSIGPGMTFAYRAALHMAARA